MNLEGLKTFLKRYRVARFVNARLKCWQMRRRYQSLCQRYRTPSVLTDERAIAELGRQLRAGTKDSASWQNSQVRPRVLYVGTDWEQDRSGIVQALNALAEVSLFENEPGKYGQRRPKMLTEIDMLRQHNAGRLLQHLEAMERAGPVHAIIGQMWGFSMHWRALAEVQRRGIAVVNISMDDRHAFVCRRLADGMPGGTLGLAPHLTLACTDAPECVRWYEAEGCRAIYLPEASDPDLFHPLPGPKLYDVCFVGANYGIRAQMVRALERAGIQVQVYGYGWPNGRIPTAYVPALFARSKIVLGCGTVGYCSDFLALKLRDFDGPMSGSLYMTHANPDLGPLFVEGQEIVLFHDISEMVAKARHYLAHESERENLARAGRNRAMREHTWVARFNFIMACLGQISKTQLNR